MPNPNGLVMGSPGKPITGRVEVGWHRVRPRSSPKPGIASSGGSS